MKRSDKMSSIFIGSSVEGLPVAEALHSHFEHEDALDARIWTHEDFELSRATLDSLEDFVKKFDYGVFVLTPDDTAEKRNETVSVPRDNVVFELGLFLGRLGRDRTIALRPRHPAISLPSDLAGIATADYTPADSHDQWKSNLAQAAVTIKRHVHRVSSLSTSSPDGASPVLNEDVVLDALELLLSSGDGSRIAACRAILEHLADVPLIFGASSERTRFFNASLNRMVGDPRSARLLQQEFLEPRYARAARFEYSHHLFAKGCFDRVLGLLEEESAVSLGSHEVAVMRGVCLMAAGASDQIEVGGLSRSIEETVLPRHSQLHEGIIWFALGDPERGESAWDRIKRPEWGQDAVFGPPLGRLSDRLDALFIDAVVGPERKEGSQLDPRIVDLVDLLKQGSLSGEAHLIARTAKALRLNSSGLETIVDLSRGGGKRKRKWKFQLNTALVERRLMKIEREIWSWAGQLC